MPVTAISTRDLVTTDLRRSLPSDPVNQRLTGVEMLAYNRPRACFAEAPLVRLIGWMLLSHGGRWFGSGEELLERLREEIASPTAEQVDLGANASTFGRRFAAARGALEAAGIGISRERSVIDGVDRWRWRLWATDCVEKARDERFDRFAAERLVVTGDLVERSTAAEIWDAYLAWSAPDELMPKKKFHSLLRDEALRRGAYPTEIGGHSAFKGLRLARLPDAETAAALADQPSRTKRALLEVSMVRAGGGWDRNADDARTDARQKAFADARRQVDEVAAHTAAGADARVRTARVRFWIAAATSAASLLAAVWLSLSVG